MLDQLYSIQRLLLVQSGKIHSLFAKVAKLVEYKPGASVWEKLTQQQTDSGDVETKP